VGVAVRDFNDELDGYVYLPRMFDKARAKLNQDRDAPVFGCPLDHSCMARLRVYPEDVLDLVRVHGDDDAAILSALRERGIPEAADTWFDAQALEDEELLKDVYLRVRPLDRIDEIEQRPGDEVMIVEQGEALISLGERQQRIVRAGEVVRIPPDLPHTIESIGSEPLRVGRRDR
jgi:hypothetical protein